MTQKTYDPTFWVFKSGSRYVVFRLKTDITNLMSSVATQRRWHNTNKFETNYRYHTM